MTLKANYLGFGGMDSCSLFALQRAVDVVQTASHRREFPTRKWLEKRESRGPS
jgi:hypothetical protein